MIDRHASQNPSASGPQPEATLICSSTDSASLLVRVLDEYLSDLQAGRLPDKARLLASHPELAHELENCLAGIDFIHQAAKPSAGPPTQLGDFRILREVGRGGMGVVYEAEQLSLKRRVALKVLRFGVTADPEVMQRFQREAETVAHLHHTNIVPIHAIGCEQGVHYYAMQFIEGRSLAAVLSEHDSDAGIDFKEIAGWTLQAAEALAYAHQRGVIHRDIKPSNLILDPQGTVWLTDFGLAKRADEVTLTAAGILMGTPRYMSPEQAAAAKQPVDHRTDIYSLGATLYELATGKPVFDGQSPQGVITQILNSEPVSPRLLQGKLPRDLETIILKCLAKEPSQRYQQAHELADDLRAYLENRAILARRASVTERAARWIKKHQRSTTAAAISAAVSLLLIAGGLASWSTYRESLNGRLSLTTEGPSLVAEVLNDKDELVIPSFPVPNPQPVVLPAGQHRVRLSGAGSLSETWTMEVERGEEHSYGVKLLDRFLAPPLEVPGRDPPVWVTLNGQMHVFHRVERGWRLTRGDSLTSAWSNDLTKFPEKPDDAPYPNTYVWGAWHDLLQTVRYASVSGETGSAPGVSQPAVDVNGDGRDDLILGSRVSPSLVAVSGQDGKVLWWYRALPNFPKDHDAAADPFNLKGSAEQAGVLQQPITVSVNGEPAVIAAFVSDAASLHTQAGKNFTSGRTFYVEAVAARTGTQIWRALFDLPELATTYTGELVTLFAPQPVVVEVEGKQTIALHAGTKLFGFDLETGAEAWPAIDVGARPVQIPKFADFNGDGSPEVLWLFRKDRDSDELTLKTMSLPAGAVAWERSFLCPTQLQHDEIRGQGNELIWVTDLDSDGKAEVIIPVKDDWQKHAPHWFGIEVLDGATGARRWGSQLCSIGHFSGVGMGSAIRLLTGPDMDGDGHRDLFTASLGSTIRITDNTGQLQVDALSGKDGRLFWMRRYQVADQFNTIGHSGRFQWGQADAEGLPQLVVPVAKGVGGQPITYVLSASIGRVEHVLPEVSDPQVADVNNDGIPDIYHLTGESDSRRLSVLKGLPPVEWRRLGNWRPARDYDGDGVAELLAIRTPLLVVRSGRDHHILWQSKCNPMFRSTTQLMHMDVDGDGISDVVFMETREGSPGHDQTVTVLSGKDGQRLWTAPDFGLNASSVGSSGGGPQQEFQYPMLDQCDLDGDGRSEILVAGYIAMINTVSLAALSHQDGRLLWKIPIHNGAFVGESLIDRHVWHDLNGDGVLDIALWVPQSIGEQDLPIGNEVRAFSGRDGSALWKKGYVGQGWWLWPRNPIDDIDGDGTAEVAVTSRTGTGAGEYELAVLDGRTGERKWNWNWQPGDSVLWGPQFVNAYGDGRRLVCLGVHEQGQSSNVVVLDAQGQLRERIPVGWLHASSAWTAMDVNDDGKEELLYASDNQLHAYQLSEQNALWKRDFGTHWLQLNKAPRDPTDGRDSLQSWSFRTASGIDLATGVITWRCDVAKPDNFQLQSDLSFSEGSALPIAVSHDAHEQNTFVQRAWPTNADGRYRSPQSAPISFGEFVPPTRYRQLPWVRNVASLNPLRWLNEAEMQSGRVKIMLVLLEWPMFLVFVGASLRWLCRAQWRPLLAYWLLFCVMAVGFAAASLWMRSRWLEADERFSWDGWYWILWSNGLSLGALTIFVLMGKWLLKRLRRALAWNS